MSLTDHEQDVVQDAGISDDTTDVIPDLHEHQRETRRPGEAVFTLLMLAGSVALLWNAYGISGFEALSAPGTVPMATTLVMTVAAAIIAFRTVRLPRISGETFLVQILPVVIIVMVALLVGYALLLKPLGFLPTSALFMIVSIKFLWRRGWGGTLLVSLGALLGIYIVFRLIFTVLMPAGIVPEGEILQYFRNIFAAGGA